ncbi:hypothetical protein G4B88_001043 [Cannabis sativa]|uniref:Uncharacterized protein n=1 Tax=Cannabis sativa TaxID=3483 RepID=A0A7J6FE26_CANSA|nr:hypothetical protein G4B88_001043 [Cannabis sativa]
MVITSQTISYMKSVYNATDKSLGEEYDCIVVRGGTAGYPLAFGGTNIFVMASGRPVLVSAYEYAKFLHDKGNLTMHA